MTLAWDDTAQSYLDQLPLEEQRRIAHPLDGGLARLYAVRVGADLRVPLRRDDAIVTVVDIVRRSQIEGFRRASREPAVATICRGP
jgi:hypothetical protein